MNSELLRGIQYFTRETEILSALSAACGAGERTERAMDGDCRENSVFDLASVTKLFTGLCAMRLKEEGLLDFSRPVFDYDPRFEALRETSVFELMTFARMIRTPERIDACAGREEALRCLFRASPGEASGKRAYSDIPAMILKYAIEAAWGGRFYDCVRELVLAPAGMTETWARVPDSRLGDCQDYGLEHRIEKERRVVRTGPAPGVPHDPKAAVIQGGTDDLCGHAGLFSTRGDMVRFCRAVLERRIVSEASLKEMTVNRTGRRLEDGSWTQFLGYQCYLRHPDQYYSEIPAYMGARAFGIGGFTGNHVSVDPEKDVFVIFLGNRVHNRLTVLLPEDGKTLKDYGLRLDGSGTFRWDDGEELFSSVKYVHRKDAHFHRRVAETLGLPLIPYDEAVSGRL